MKTFLKILKDTLNKETN